MSFKNAFIPYGGYWSTPFVKWQGKFSSLHPLKFAADVAVGALSERDISPEMFTALYLGNTVPSPSSFYGTPWVAGLIGAEGITGPMFAQACATSTQVISSAARTLTSDQDETILCLTADRTSNGPHLSYPNPLGPGGRPDTEDWVWDSFQEDPYAGGSMLQTAENVAKVHNITTEEQHHVVLMRHAQYQDALADDAAFHKRFMQRPLEVNPTGRKVIGVVEGDEGVFPSSAEGLAKLRPVMRDGTVTFGGQTFPADGNAGMIVTNREKAHELSRKKGIEIEILAFAQARTAKGHMPQANEPAVRRVLKQANLTIGEMQAIKTHNPFAVNDVFLSRALGIPLEGINNYGSSLIWGHPQGPTGMRLVIELIEELVLLGGGYGLFTGCAAGDTAAALILEVRNAS